MAPDKPRKLRIAFACVLMLSFIWVGTAHADPFSSMKKGIHKGLSEAKKGIDKASGKTNKGAHKGLDKAEKGMNKGIDKTKKAVSH